MDRYFTVMVIPEMEKGVRSFRVPRIIFRALVFLFLLLAVLLAILAFDYWNILKQVYENKHLKTENRLLKEQIKLNQMKINTLTEDIRRIHTFEEKLKIITGLKAADLTKEYPERNPNSLPESNNSNPTSEPPISDQLQSLLPAKTSENKNSFDKLKKLYEIKIAENFGQQTGYTVTKGWNQLTQQSFALADQFALFDNQFNVVKTVVKQLEIDIHEIDEFLLDRDSFIKSTPTLLPAKGWITSYYGNRSSPYSGREKMHEGLDIGAQMGTPIYAPADGTVTFAGQKPGFGIIVQLDHGYGLETIFAHAQKSKVQKGQPVKRGDMIASVGSTGYSTGPHLHYEIRVNGTPVDPLYYILD